MATARHWQNDPMFLGEDLLAWLVLALGGALFVGNALAIVKPPPAAKDGDLARAPVGRSVVMSLVGLVAAPLAGAPAGGLGAWAGGATALGILAVRELRRTSATQEAESARLGALIREADERYAALWEERMRLQESLLHSQKLSQPVHW